MKFTLTIVIGFAHNENILKERDESERVYNQRKSANHILRVVNSTRERIVENIQGRSS